ncbi:hypothetical protein EUX98_g2675 [Antrodiella citrinella]|uniref:Cytochrome b5 heme-binding domain-containing protein n=1 Tax=Antrodiella citrinella TaxID=2447956 RepID=A0A4S4MZS4_9APHY|nr:hypothetical protein EUX98_g2675 [Antrodiella citrinella]
MSSYIRGWLSSALPAAQPSQPEPDVVITTSAPPDEGNDSDNDTIRGDGDEDDDLPPAFPSLNSAQRVETGSKPGQQKKYRGIPNILRSDSDSKLMPPPPVPSLASRKPGVALSSASSSLGVPGSSLMPPPTTSKAPSRRSRKVALGPGYGALDWGNLKKSGTDLRGVDNLMRIPMSVLKEHNKKDDAWSAFNGKVYNITHYLPFHPGGEKELMRVAGRDGTKLFDRIIQQALIEGLGTADNGTDGKAADRDSTPYSRIKMDLDDIFDYVVLHSPGKDLIVKPEGRATVPSSEFISDELLSRGNVSDNKSAPLPSLIEPPYMAVASTSSSQPSPPPPSSGIPSTLQEVRQILLPVILQNALRRDPHADSEAIKRSAVDLLTDEQCLEFVRLAQETRTQLAAKEERERQRVPKQQLSSERDIGIPVDPTRIREHAPQEITSATGDMQRIQDNGWPKDRVPSASLGVVVPVLAPDEGEAGELENDSGRPKPINAGAEVEAKMKGDEKDKLWDDRPRRQHSCDHNPGRGSDWDRGRVLNGISPLFKADRKQTDPGIGTGVEEVEVQLLETLVHRIILDKENTRTTRADTLTLRRMIVVNPTSTVTLMGTGNTTIMRVVPR